MTGQELNRDIKRLYKRFDESKISTEFMNTAAEWDAYEKEQDALKKEFLRLWHADKEKTVTKLKQLKMLLIMNSSLRVITLHAITYDFKI